MHDACRGICLVTTTRLDIRVQSSEHGAWCMHGSLPKQRMDGALDKHSRNINSPEEISSTHKGETRRGSEAQSRTTSVQSMRTQTAQRSALSL